MEANAGMVAGSHKRNELVRIRHDSDSGVSVLEVLLFGFASKKEFCFCVIYLIVYIVSVFALWCVDLSGG